MPANATGAIRITVKLRTRGSSRLLIGVVPDGTSRSAEDEMRRKFLDEVVAAGMRPEAVADLVHDAVCNDRFWIFTDLNMMTVLAEKHDSIMENRNPVPPMVSAHRRPRQSHQGRSPGIQGNTPHFTAQNPDFHCRGATRYRPLCR